MKYKVYLKSGAIVEVEANTVIADATLDKTGDAIAFTTDSEIVSKMINLNSQNLVAFFFCSEVVGMSIVS